MNRVGLGSIAVGVLPVKQDAKEDLSGNYINIIRPIYSILRMTDDICPTLTEIARQTYWEPGFELASNVIDRALVEAGLSPNDCKERIRFRNLVEDAYYQRLQDELAQLGEHADEARRELGDDASIDDVIYRAHEIKDEVEGEDDAR